MTSFLAPLSKIKIDREKRQRRSLPEIEAMAASLKSRGQINPIVIDENFNLIAGERRYSGAKLLGWEEIEVKMKSDLTEEEAFAIELEENVQREDLSWQDNVLAHKNYFDLCLRQNPEVTQIEVATKLGVPLNTLSIKLSVAAALVGPDAAVIKDMQSWRTAYNYLSRSLAREADAALDDILSGQTGGQSSTEEGQLLAQPSFVPHHADPASVVFTDSSEARQEIQPKPVVVPEQKFIHKKNFLEWAQSYDGPRFNFIHCDFPYGIDHDKSEQGNANVHGAYSDSKEIYFQLLHHFITHRDNFIAGSAHILFWLSMNYYQDTVELFRANDFVVNPTPLIWFKSDNVGILPDPNRGPRQVYETALLISRGDRKVVKAVGNCKAFPGAKQDMIHLSEKPQEMLEHFFSMLVDSTTTFLDPTCGSGSSLRAAYTSGAKTILGFDISEENVNKANVKLNSTMRAL